MRPSLVPVVAVLAVLAVLSCGSAPCPEPSHATSDEAPADLVERSIRDADAIRTAIRAAAPTLDSAAARLDAATGAASGVPAAVDYGSIEELRALEQPFAAGAFHRRVYTLFRPATVDALFAYYLDVLRFFDEVERLANRTVPEARRGELDRTAATLDATATYGVVLSRPNGAIAAQLAFLEPVVDGSGAPTGRVVARATRTGAGREFAIYGGEPIDVEPRYVIAIDGGASSGVLASQAGAFVEYVRALEDLNAQMATLREIEAQLLTELDAIAELAHDD